MEISTNYGFNLPSRDTDDIVDIDLISDNFRKIDEQMVPKENDKGLSTNDYTDEDKAKVEAAATATIDQSYDPESTNAQSGVAVAEAVSGKMDKFGEVKYDEKTFTYSILPGARLDCTAIRFKVYTDEESSYTSPSGFKASTPVIELDNFNGGNTLVIGVATPDGNEKTQATNVEYVDTAITSAVGDINAVLATVVEGGAE